MTEKETWTDPIFNDAESSVARISMYVDWYGSAHVALPKTGNSKVIRLLKNAGFRLEKMVPDDTTGLINRNQCKKLSFYAITRPK